MKEETFAEYFLQEKEWTKKIEIMFYLKKRLNIFFDNTVVFKSLLTKLFCEYVNAHYPDERLNTNLVVSARLLCDCKKISVSNNVNEIRNYAKNGALFIASLGFSTKFCAICEGVNRYTIKEDREKESDVLELTDQFGGMLIDRNDRTSISIEDALDLLQFRNLKGVYNRYLNYFVEFIRFMQDISIEEVDSDEDPSI